MKLFILALVLYFGRVAFSCHKNIDPLQTTSDSSLIRLKGCAIKTFGSETVSLCLDSVLQDSRCPVNVNCIWAGTAVAKFSFTNRNTTYPIVLSTLKFGGYSPDTILSGYKINFINLIPYPGTPSAPITAAVRITKQ